jgi:hypothetical protein
LEKNKIFYRTLIIKKYEIIVMRKMKNKNKRRVREADKR